MSILPKSAVLLSEPLGGGSLPKSLLAADPVSTANIYCFGRLDEVIQAVLHPVWLDFRKRHADFGCRIWLVRYGRGGEHLKVRLHAPESVRSLFEELLGRSAQTYFAGLGAPVDRLSRAKWRSAPPIDEEDLAPEDHPDRTLLWTTYHRSPVCLGDGIFLEDDLYIANMTVALACACETMLSTLDAASGVGLTAPVRRSAMMSCLLAGTGGLGLKENEQTAYLAYHRDWLLRSASLQSRERPVGLLNRLDQQIDESGACLEPLRAEALQHWLGEHVQCTRSELPLMALRQSVTDLVCHVRLFHGHHQMDPFSRDPVFSAGFKVLHGAANQFGLDLLNEALIYQLVLRATAADDHPALSNVELMPPPAEGGTVR